jgi:hypothetical protein
MPRDADKQRGREQLNCWIANRDMLFAATAFRSEHHPTENGNVVVKSNRGATRSTTRIGKDDRLFERNAMNYNIKKTPDDRPKDPRDNIPNYWRN